MIPDDNITEHCHMLAQPPTDDLDLFQGERYKQLEKKMQDFVALMRCAQRLQTAGKENVGFCCISEVRFQP